jgi:putative transposase
MHDHAHMMIRIPPKYAVSQVVGYIKEKGAIHLARMYGRESTTLWDSTSGPEVTLYPSLVGMSPSYANTSSARRRKTGRWTGWSCQGSGHLQVAPGAEARSARTAALSGSQNKAPGYAGGYLLEFHLRLTRKIEWVICG